MSKKRISKRQTGANCQNACKSTGPRTAPGKARSRLNALKHGLRAEHVVVLDGPSPEHAEEFEALRDGLIGDCKPAGVLEELLVERVAVNFWRLRRAYRFEAKSIEQANKPNPVSKMLAELSPLPVGEPDEKVLPSAPNLDKLVRYESMIDRELLRTMAQLQRLQHLRKLQEQLSDVHEPARPRRISEAAAKPQWPNEPRSQPSASAPTASGRGATNLGAVVGQTAPEGPGSVAGGVSPQDFKRPNGNFRTIITISPP